VTVSASAEITVSFEAAAHREATVPHARVASREAVPGLSPRLAGYDGRKNDRARDQCHRCELFHGC